MSGRDPFTVVFRCWTVLLVAFAGWVIYEEHTSTRDRRAAIVELIGVPDWEPSGDRITWVDGDRVCVATLRYDADGVPAALDEQTCGTVAP